MSQERISEIQELLFNIDRKIKPLEWDDNRNQINEFRKLELARLKEEHANLNQELNGLQQQK